VRLGLAQRPAHATWAQVYGVSLLCRVGFTMSLFIGLLAFADAPALEAGVKIGVLAGSVACMISGALVLLVATSREQRARPSPA
jgi:NhaA family Na+:H+ antiporter